MLYGQIYQSKPELFVRDPKVRGRFRAAIYHIVSDLVVDVNAELKELGEDFDYRGKLRDAAWVKGLEKIVVGDHVKLVTRGKIPSFKDDWEASSKKTEPRLSSASGFDGVSQHQLLA